MVLKWHVFAIAILIGWFELVLLSGRLPQLSVQLEMVRAVTVIFLKIMEGYVLLLVVFALAFYVLSQIVLIWTMLNYFLALPLVTEQNFHVHG